MKFVFLCLVCLFFNGTIFADTPDVDNNMPPDEKLFREATWEPYGELIWEKTIHRGTPDEVRAYVTIGGNVSLSEFLANGVSGILIEIEYFPVFQMSHTCKDSAEQMSIVWEVGSLSGRLINCDSTEKDVSIETSTNEMLGEIPEEIVSFLKNNR